MSEEKKLTSPIEEPPEPKKPPVIITPDYSKLLSKLQADVDEIRGKDTERGTLLDALRVELEAFKAAPDPEKKKAAALVDPLRLAPPAEDSWNFLDWLFPG